MSNQKPTDVTEEVRSAEAAAAAEIGTQADVDEIMKKYDRESNTRPWEGVPAVVIKVLLAAFSIFMIYMNLFVVWDERIRRSLFLGVVILFVFLIFPATKSMKQKVNHIPFYDILIGLAGAVSFFYFTFIFFVWIPIM